MNLFFSGKVLSCLGATGAVGVVGVLPKIKSTFLVTEEDLELSSIPETEFEEEVFITDVNSEVETETTSEDSDAQIQEKQTIIGRILSWLYENGNCEVSLAVDSQRGQYFQVSDGAWGEFPDDESMFTKNISVGSENKSKIEILADDLEKGREDNRERFGSYIRTFAEKCRKESELKLQWRDEVTQGNIEAGITYEDASLLGLKNLWVYEKAK